MVFHVVEIAPIIIEVPVVILSVYLLGRRIFVRHLLALVIEKVVEVVVVRVALIIFWRFSGMQVTGSSGGCPARHLFG